MWRIISRSCSLVSTATIPLIFLCRFSTRINSNEKTSRRHFVTHPVTTSIFRLFFYYYLSTPLVYALLSTSRGKKEAALRKSFDREEVKFHLSFLSVFKLSLRQVERRDRMVLSTIDHGYWNSKIRGIGFDTSNVFFRLCFAFYFHPQNEPRPWRLFPQRVLSHVPGL